MWHFPPYNSIVVVPDGERCSVMDAWELGGGVGRIRNKHVFPLNSNGALCVEFDDSPGFWWIVPRVLVILSKDAGAEEVTSESSSS